MKITLTVLPGGYEASNEITLEGSRSDLNLLLISLWNGGRVLSAKWDDSALVFSADNPPRKPQDVPGREIPVETSEDPPVAPLTALLGVLRDRRFYELGLHQTPETDRAEIADIFRRYQGRPFDVLIGRLDRLLSEIVEEGRRCKKGPYDSIDRQTLKHHAEDLVLAGQKILKDIGEV